TSRSFWRYWVSAIGKFIPKSGAECRINGKLPPKIHSVSGGGHFFFDGQEIKEWLALKND
ncbi:hypothetical protein Q7I32_20255, partial [Aeromonas veronii]